MNENAVDERFQLNPTDVYSTPQTGVYTARMTAVEAERLD